MLLDCDEGGARQAPKVTRRGAVVATLVDHHGQPLSAHAPVGGILKRLTTLLALLPARLGRAGAVDSLSVTTASDELGAPLARVERVEGKGLLLLAPANATRRRFWICNDGKHDLRIKFGLGASECDFTLRLGPGEFYDSKSYPAYTGIITGYGRGVTAQVTEI